MNRSRMSLLLLPMLLGACASTSDLQRLEADLSALKSQVSTLQQYAQRNQQESVRNHQQTRQELSDLRDYNLKVAGHIRTNTTAMQQQVNEIKEKTDRLRIVGTNGNACMIGCSGTGSSIELK